MFRNKLKLMAVFCLFIGSGLDVQAGEKSAKKQSSSADNNTLAPKFGKRRAVRAITPMRSIAVRVENSEMDDASPAPRTPQQQREDLIYMATQSVSMRRAVGLTKSLSRAREFGHRSRSSKTKEQLSKVGIKTDDDRVCLANLIALADVVSLREFLIHGTSDVDVLRDKIVYITKLIELGDKILAHKHWKFIAPLAQDVELVKPQLEAIKKELVPQLEALDKTLGDAIAQGHLVGGTVARVISMDHEGRVLSDSNDAVPGSPTSDGSDASEDSEETQPGQLIEWRVEDEGIEPSTTPDEISYVQQVLNTCAQEKGMSIAVGTIGICYIIAGVCCPVIIPAMAVGTGIGAGIGGGISLVRGDDARTTVRKMTCGALAGTVAPLVEYVVVPSMVGGSFVAEATLEGAVTGFITGAASAHNDHERLSKAFRGAACGAVVGAVLYELKEVYTAIIELRATIARLGQRVDSLEQRVGSLEIRVDSLEITLEGVVAENERQNIAIDELKRLVRENARTWLMSLQEYIHGGQSVDSQHTFGQRVKNTFWGTIDWFRGR